MFKYYALYIIIHLIVHYIKNNYIFKYKIFVFIIFTFHYFLNIKTSNNYKILIKLNTYIIKHILKKYLYILKIKMMY